MESGGADVFFGIESLCPLFLRQCGIQVLPVVLVMIISMSTLIHSLLILKEQRTFWSCFYFGIQVYIYNIYIMFIYITYILCIYINLENKHKTLHLFCFLACLFSRAVLKKSFLRDCGKVYTT